MRTIILFSIIFLFSLSQFRCDNPSSTDSTSIDTLYISADTVYQITKDTLIISAEDTLVISRIDTIVLAAETLVVRDTVFFAPDTTIIRDSIFVFDTVVSKDSTFSYDTLVTKDTVFTFDTIVVRDSVFSYDTVYVNEVGCTVHVYKGQFSTSLSNVSHDGTAWDIQLPILIGEDWATLAYVASYSSWSSWILLEYQHELSTSVGYILYAWSGIVRVYDPSLELAGDYWKIVLIAP